jgi:outer membrane protein assembly factor BamE (lipoprotein component of BamABCDE complex)
MNLNKFLIFLILITLSACQYSVHSGTKVTDAKLSEVKVSKISKAEVENILGSPNIIPDYSKDTWYYVHRDMTRRSFLIPVVKSQRIVKITFKDDSVNSIEILDDSHDKDIRIVKDYIKSKGSDKNAFQEYVQNFGRFNKYKSKEKRR